MQIWLHRDSRVMHGFPIVIMSNTSTNNQNPKIKTKHIRIDGKKRAKKREANNWGKSPSQKYYYSTVLSLYYCVTVLHCCTICIQFNKKKL